MRLNLYNEKKDVIRKYFLTGKKDLDEANKILKKDKKLKKLDPLIIGVSFELGVYNELGILYKRTFEIMDESNHLTKITCTENQLKELVEHNKAIEKFTFNCRYLGELIINDMKIYELVDYDK